MTEIFSGKYPECNMPNDVDDIYLDSLKEQAEKLGIFVQIQQNISNCDGNVNYDVPQAVESGSKSSENK